MENPLSFCCSRLFLSAQTFEQHDSFKPLKETGTDSKIADGPDHLPDPWPLTLTFLLC
jgi:hypothetical protein